VSRSAPAPAQRRRERRAAARAERAPKIRSRARGPRPAWRSPVLLISAAAVIVGAALVALALPKNDTAGEELRIPLTSYEAGLATGDVLGSATAPVVVELYSDFQCPACKLFVTTELKQLTDEFVRPGIARIEARDIAFLGRGTPDESLELAVGAACAAEQGRYWQFHDLVFWNQGRENGGDHDAAFIGRVADQARLDRAAFDACLTRDDIRAEVRSATNAAVAAGVHSTPTIVVNGRSIVGVPEYATLAAAIREAAGSATPAPVAPS
jgi:protein-disulfide isomerase